MSLQEDPPITVAVGGGTVEFPRFVYTRGQQMTAEQVEREAAAFAQADQLMGNRPSGARQPGDDDDGAVAPDKRTREQRQQDVDFEAEAVKIVSRIEAAKRRGGA